MVFSQLGNNVGNSLDFGGTIGNSSFSSGLESLGTKAGMLGNSIYNTAGTIGNSIGSGLESIGNYADKYGKGIDALTGLGGLYLQKQNYDDQRDYQNRLMALAEGKQERAETMEDQAISNMQTGFASSGLSRKKPTSLSSVTV